MTVDTTAIDTITRETTVTDSLPPVFESGSIDAAFDASPLPKVTECAPVTPTVGKLADGAWALRGTSDGAAFGINLVSRKVEAISLTTGSITKICDEFSTAIRADARAALIANDSDHIYSFRACDGVHVLGKSPPELTLVSSPRRVAGITSDDGTRVLFVETTGTPTLTLSTIDGSSSKAIAPFDDKCFEPLAVAGRWLTDGCGEKLFSVDATTGAAFELLPGAARVLDVTPAKTIVAKLLARYLVPTAGGIAVPIPFSPYMALTRDASQYFYVDTAGDLHDSKSAAVLASKVQAMRLLPDDKHIVFSRNVYGMTGDLWLLTLATGEIKNLSTDTVVTLADVTLTEDGTYLVWNQVKGTETDALRARRFSDGFTLNLGRASAFMVARNTVVFGVPLASPMFASKLYALDLVSGTGVATLVANEAIGFFYIHPSRRHVVFASSAELRVTDIP